MNNTQSISAVFIFVVLLLLGLGGVSLFYLEQISQKTENLYYHPYSVSNAVRNIDTSIVSMHNHMKDVALANGPEDIKLATIAIDTHEVKVLKNFELVFNRYLGSKSDISNAYQAFIHWKVIRDEVILLINTGKYKDATLITQNKETAHVELLTTETKKLIDYADNKAKSFLDNSREFKRQAFFYISALLATALLSSALLSFYTVRRLSFAQREMSKRMQLIDQNILMAKMTVDGSIEEISNQLCRYLSVTKKEMQGKQSNFFVDPQLTSLNINDIYKMTETGNPWQGEIKLLLGNGEIHWIDSIVHPNLDSSFNITGYTNIIQDITDKKEIEQLSITDSLTSLYNRRHFDNMIEREIKISRRNHVALVFAMIDIDYFKNFNDEYGHVAGDSVLIKVSRVLKMSMLRPNDFVFRLGGEEFGLLFSNVDIESAEALLETIRASIEDLSIEHSASNVSEFVTISVGATIDINNSLNSIDIYSKADELLYKAKVSRNTVIMGS